ncbi:hypothetical protein K7G90_001756 [Pasteurella canis]|uniref:Transmembrane protein n=1 Tax=Pasteurella canis TaxID=753 RepID=A0ABQ4VIP0_9PAST|nr:hypothetical protein [Pasteurella canis]UAY77496.1 hypothetical protein K7G90_001756 [Pasteurella canis]UDW83516.1 hypothetical protein K7G91_001882 [Pasteurella canis]UEC23024.1 hypothetical protein K7G93_001793 [Pasteurella canis]GJH43439.1 hypothetical protein PA42_16130 [Pasteurella canis]GJJ81168.1 hypothetical protein PcPA57_18880 [Pasteurella canis]
MTDKQFAFLQRFLFLFYRHKKWIFIHWGIFGFLGLFLLLIEANLIIFNDAGIKYASYYDLTVEIKDNRVYGKLNQYIEVKHRNNHCYTAHCGFPNEGHYTLSELQFITVNGEDFIKKMCVKNSACYQNLFDEHIEAYVKKQRHYLIDEYGRIFWLLFLTSFLSFPFMPYQLEHAKQRYRKMQEDAEFIQVKIEETTIEL